MPCPILCADPTLTFDNLRHVTSSVKEWFGSLTNLGDYNYGLGVPYTVMDEIINNPDKDKKTKVLLYFLHNVPMASWEKVAGVLYYRKEERALQAVKKFLTVSSGQSAILYSSSNYTSIFGLSHHNLDG